MDKKKGLLVSLLFAAFIAISLSCASEPEPEKANVTMKNLESWTVGLEQSALCDTQISIIQWKYLVKELNKVGELDNIEIAESKGMTSMNLESTIQISQTAMKYVYSLASEDDKIVLRITSIKQVDDSVEFNKVMLADQVAGYKDSVIKKVSEDLKKHADQLIEKKVYLE